MGDREREKIKIPLNQNKKKESKCTLGESIACLLPKDNHHPLSTTARSPSARTVIATKQTPTTRMKKTSSRPTVDDERGRTLRAESPNRRESVIME